MRCSASNTLGIVVSYNGSQFLRECIKKLQCSGVKNICIIDNASSDVSALKELENEGVEVLWNTQNVGYGSAINLVINLKKDQFRFFLVCNQDLLVPPECFTKLSKEMEGKVITYPSIQEGEVAHSYPISFSLKYGWLCYTQQSSENEVPFFHGGCFLFDYKQFRSISGNRQHLFDENIFMYHEDLEASLFLHTIGGEIAFVSEVTCQHDERPRELAIKSNLENYFYVLKIYFPITRIFQFLLFLPSVLNFQRKHYISRSWISNKRFLELIAEGFRMGLIKQRDATRACRISCPLNLFETSFRNFNKEVILHS